MRDEYEIERFEHAGRTVVICTDPDPMNPRTEYDNLTRLFCWHRHYNLGDNKKNYGMSDGEPLTAKELIRLLKSRGEKVMAILPLYLYDHSGISMSTGAFGDRWDSGQVGWGVVLASDAEKMGCVGETKYDKAFFEEAIKGDVETYDQYLTNSVYGFQIEGQDGEVIDSCWGFFGELDYVRSEAKEAAEGSEDPAVQEAADELAERATFAGAP
jgi:hypothetical protein